MGISAKYVHTNLVAQDWQALASFYQQLFGCNPVPPRTRPLRRNARCRNRSLRRTSSRRSFAVARLWGERPTLEIFSYNALEFRPKTAVNRPGFGHIAFSVDDVAVALVGADLLGGDQQFPKRGHFQPADGVGGGILSRLGHGRASSMVKAAIQRDRAWSSRLPLWPKMLRSQSRK